MRQSRKQHGRSNDNISDKIKIKLDFCSGLGMTTVRDLDEQVKWAAVPGGEVPGALKTPPKKIHTPLPGCSRGLRATGAGPCQREADG